MSLVLEICLAVIVGWASLMALAFAAEVNHKWLMSTGMTDEEIFDTYVTAMDEFLYGDG